MASGTILILVILCICCICFSISIGGGIGTYFYIKQKNESQKDNSGEKIIKQNDENGMVKNLVKQEDVLYK